MRKAGETIARYPVKYSSGRVMKVWLINGCLAAQAPSIIANNPGLHIHIYPFT